MFASSILCNSFITLIMQLDEILSGDNCFTFEKIHRSFILFTRRKLYFYVLFRIFLGMINLSEIEILLEMTNF